MGPYCNTKQHAPHMMLVLFIPLDQVVANFNYHEALSKSILFFEYQRSGKLPSHSRSKWRGDSGMYDGADVGVDLTGGYYDAGDNIKFGVPMAHTATMLSWGAIEYGKHMSRAGEKQHAEEAIKWITDYLLKAITGPKELWVQVGDANADHACWERPEDMDTPRQLYKIDERNPGTEPAAETAAALAAASIVFKYSDPHYAEKLKDKAIEMFIFADQHRVSYSRSCPFYCSFSGFNDELLWGAAWLYEATGSKNFLDYVVNNAYMSTTANVFSWDNKFAGVQVLLSKHFLSGNGALDRYKDHADSYFCSILPSSPLKNIRTTPGGLLFTLDSTNTAYATAASFLSVAYSDYLNTHGGKVYCGGIEIEPDSLYWFSRS